MAASCEAFRYAVALLLGGVPAGSLAVARMVLAIRPARTTLAVSHVEILGLAATLVRQGDRVGEGLTDADGSGRRHRLRCHHARRRAERDVIEEVPDHRVPAARRC